MRSNHGTKNHTGLMILAGIFIILAGCIWGVSMNVRSLLISTIGQSGIDAAVSHRMMDAVFQESGMTDTDWLLEIQTEIEQSPQVSQITEKLLTEMTDSLTERRGFQGVDIEAEIEGLIDDVQTRAEESGAYISEQQAELLRSELMEKTEDIETVINEYASGVFSYVKDGTGAGNRLVRLYTVLDSVWFKCTMSVILLGLIVLTVVISPSVYRALAFLGGGSLMIAAAFLFVFGAMGNRLMMLLSNHYMGRTMMLETDSLNKTGFIFLAAGILLILASFIIRFRQNGAAGRGEDRE